MPYLPHKTCCPDPVASAAAIPDEANCSWLHQSHHCANRKPISARYASPKYRKHCEKTSQLNGTNLQYVIPNYYFPWVFRPLHTSENWRIKPVGPLISLYCQNEIRELGFYLVGSSICLPICEPFLSTLSTKLEEFLSILAKVIISMRRCARCDILYLDLNIDLNMIISTRMCVMCIDILPWHIYQSSFGSVILPCFLMNVSTIYSIPIWCVH